MNSGILDIHTHRPAPVPLGVVSLDLDEMPELMADQAYSIGLHPWKYSEVPDEALWERFENIASRPEIVAIGECGVDLARQETPLFRQLQIFRRQVELSEKLQKPMIIHDVKAHDIIAGMRRDLKPTQKWVIHGFRQKFETARMLLRAGCWLSFGPLFNEDTLKEMPRDRILAETDTADVDIAEVILSMSRAVGWNLTEEICRNSAEFLFGK